MALTATSFGLWISIAEPPAPLKQPKTKVKTPPPQKYHDTTPVKSMDYSFGTSPKQNCGYFQSRPSSPDKSPKL